MPLGSVYYFNLKHTAIYLLMVLKSPGKCCTEPISWHLGEDGARFTGIYLICVWLAIGYGSSKHPIIAG